MNERPKSAGRTLNKNERIAWLRLIRTENVGSATFRELIGRFGSAETALEMLPSLTLRGGRGGTVRIPSKDEAEREIEHAERFGARFIASCEPNYPPLLRSLDHAPPLVAVKGDAEVFERPAVAIVGSRNASLSGTKIARSIARDLGQSGYTIVSGLARGIDAAAHAGSLETGTIAVLAGSLDQPYPDENIPLFNKLVEQGGAAISERPFGWKTKARDFPRRNRIIAGLCLGLVVIEAAERSGSLISARLAAEYGRLVFAVPGSPLDPRAAGTNHLLKDGATLVTNAADVAGQLAPLAGLRPVSPDPPQVVAQPAVPSPGDGERACVLELLGPTPTAIDEIIRQSQLEPQQISMILLELDLAGRIERHAGGSVSLLM